MNIENNRYLFDVGVGLTASGRDGTDHADPDLTALVGRIRAAGFADGIKTWFSRARTGQVAVNPYWPRGSDLAAACFFVDDGYAFDTRSFFAFTEGTGATDPVGTADFRDWISALPGILRRLDAHPATAPLWEEYCRMINARSAQWLPMLEKADRGAKAFFGAGAPEMRFQPNLFYPYSADFVQIEDRIIAISAAPDPETMLHEAVAKYRGDMVSFAEAYGLGDFADREKMVAYGYLENDSAEACAHVMEECFVRALSVAFAGGSDERLASHAAFGFFSVPMIASRAVGLKTSAATLGDLVRRVLDEMRERRR